MSQSRTAELSIESSEHAETDADFLALRAEVRCRGFCGQTSFVIARRDVNLFAADAAALTAHASDSALLLGGFEKADQPLRLQLARAGLSGKYVARVRIATNSPRSDQWNRVETDFIAPAEAFDAFVDALRALASSTRSSASLVGDGDDIA